MTALFGVKPVASRVLTGVGVAFCSRCGHAPHPSAPVSGRPLTHGPCQPGADLCSCTYDEESATDALLARIIDRLVCTIPVDADGYAPLTDVEAMLTGIRDAHDHESRPRDALGTKCPECKAPTTCKPTCNTATRNGWPQHREE